MAEPAISLSSSSPISFTNNEVTFSVTVDGEFGPAANETVNLSIYREGELIYSTDIQLDNNGEGELMHNFSQAGVYSVNVSYLGDSNYRSGFVSILQLVMDGSRTDTNMTLTPPPSPVYVDQLVSFTLQVTPDPPNVGTVTGEVSLIIARNGSIITVRNAYLEEGIAYINYTFTEAGTYDVSAVYYGNETYNVSSAGPISIEVIDAPFTCTLTSNYNPSWYGQLVTFTFTVDAGTEGNATFYVDGNPVYSVDVVNGVATYQTATLAPGQHTISVMFTTDGMTFDVPGIRQTVLYCC